MLERLDNRQRCVVRVLVERHAPYKGRVYDPSCGSAGMFVQSEKFVEEYGGRISGIAVYGQESNSTTRRLSSSRSQRSLLNVLALLDQTPHLRVFPDWKQEPPNWPSGQPQHPRRRPER